MDDELDDEVLAGKLSGRKGKGKAKMSAFQAVRDGNFEELIGRGPASEIFTLLPK